jgi:pimeloyl-ACP methyl ester carboxylesterase
MGHVEWKHTPYPGAIELQMRSWGRNEGRPILIIHGFLEQCAAWDEVAVQLNRYVISYDQRGHGLSDHTSADGFYYFFDYIADLDGIIDTLQQPVDLVGHSMGGTISCIYAALRPERVANLVLVEGLGPPDTTANTIRQGQQFLAHRKKPPVHTPLQSIQDGVSRMQRLNPALSTERASKLVSRLSRQSRGDTRTWTWDPRHRSRSPRPFSTEQFMHYLQHINCPTLAVFGEKSRYHHMVPDLARRLNGLKICTRVDIEHAGHHPHHSHPTELSVLISDFCQEAPHGS